MTNTHTNSFQVKSEIQLQPYTILKATATDLNKGQAGTNS